MKGSVIDIAVAPIILVAVGIILLIGGYLFFQTQNILSENNISNNVSQNYFDKFTSILTTISNVFPMILVLLFLGIGLLAYKLRTSPAFIPIMIIGTILIIVFANLGVEMYSTTSNIINTSGYNPSQFYVSTEVISNLPLISLVASGIIIVVMYIASPRGVNL